MDGEHRQQDQDGGHHADHGGLLGAGHVVVDPQGQGPHARPRGERGDHDLVEGEGEREQCARRQRRAQLRKGDVQEGAEGVRPEVHGRRLLGGGGTAQPGGDVVEDHDDAERGVTDDGEQPEPHPERLKDRPERRAVRPGAAPAVGRRGRGRARRAALTAGQLRGAPPPVVSEPHRGERLPGAAHPIGAGRLAHPEPVGDALLHRHVRKQGVVLEDGVHLAREGRQVGDVPPGEFDPALVGLFEPRDQPQQRGLARAGRPEQGEELAVPDPQVDPGHRGRVPEGLPYLPRPSRMPLHGPQPFQAPAGSSREDGNVRLVPQDRRVLPA